MAGAWLRRERDPERVTYTLGDPAAYVSARPCWRSCRKTSSHNANRRIRRKGPRYRALRYATALATLCTVAFGDEVTRHRWR